MPVWLEVTWPISVWTRGHLRSVMSVWALPSRLACLLDRWLKPLRSFLVPLCRLGPTRWPCAPKHTTSPSTWWRRVSNLCACIRSTSRTSQTNLRWDGIECVGARSRPSFHTPSCLLQYKADTLKTVTNLSEEHPMIDYTPPSLITLLFTDLGVLTPSAVSDELIKLYL